MQAQHRFSHRLGRSAALLRNLTLGLSLAVAQLFTGAGAGTAQAATTNCTPNGATQSCTVTFDFTGAAETWTVPPGVTQATFDLYGAQGGRVSYGGQGGQVMATLTVIPGANYQILVGGSPGNSANPGFNGGGSGGTGYSGGGGGGASDVRSGAFALANRILVAAGGGGAYSSSLYFGGAGGYPNGGKGSDAGFEGKGGGGGTQSAGGAGGDGDITDGTPGSLGQGGNGASGSYSSGGGGGYYGGGGGGGGSPTGASGGGGSSYGPTGATFQNGVRAGNGQVIITYSQADTSAPVANPTQSPPAAPSGWNNSNVTVTWNWTDPATGYASGVYAANCTTSSVSSGSGIINLSATCRDLAGNVGTATYQVLVDPTAPTANPSQSPAANAAGWNNTDVTVNWNWVFTGAMIDTANCTTSSVSSGEGTLTLSATCRDVALNQRTATYPVKVDKTAPVVAVTGVSAGATYAFGSVPTAACSTTDGVSGVATPATVNITGGNGDGTGTFTATCSGATDVAGNSAAPVSVSYTVDAPPTATPTLTPVPPTATPTNTPVPPTATPTNTPVPPTATSTNTPVPPTATPTNTPVPPTATATATPSTGTLVGVCGPYTVYQTGSSYTAAGWSGAIKVGTNGNNTLNGGSGPDLMLGLGGNDKLDGKGGDDVLCGGDGVDLLLGMAGNDYLDGGTGNDVLNSGSGDHDQLLGGEGNDTLLDGDGVINAQGGAGNDRFTLALRKGWRDPQGQTQFAGRLAAGYGNDTVILVILDRSPFFVDVTGDERDNPASPLEGNKDGLGLLGKLSPAPVSIKFEQQLVISAEAEGIVSEEAGAEYLTEPVGEEGSEEATLNNRIFLPLINR